MKSKLKPVLIYGFYIGHLMAVLYIGARGPCQFMGWRYHQKLSLSIIPIGIILFIPAFFELGAKRSLGLYFPGLVTTGAYGVIRNPQMLGWIIILSGISIYFYSIVSLILIAILWIFFKTVHQPLEEKKLTREYGKAYLDYKKETVSGI